MKTCFTCETEKQARLFTGGNSSTCNDCIRRKRKRCTACKDVKCTTDFYSATNATCIECNRKACVERYHNKMQDPYFILSERHRRLEKFHRREKEHYLKLMQENKTIPHAN